jgi:hypothetical protein
MLILLNLLLFSLQSLIIFYIFPRIENAVVADFIPCPIDIIIKIRESENFVRSANVRINVGPD